MANRAFIRFRNITILNRAEVSNVYVRFTAYSNRSDTPVNLRCAFVDEDNPDAPVTFSQLQSYNLTDWVSWNSLNSWIDGDVYATPDLTAILQGILERIGWESGNSVMLIIEDVSSTGQKGFSSVRFSDGNEKPILFVTYLAREPSIIITGRSYIFGGYDLTNALKDCDEYTPDTWAEKTDLLSVASGRASSFALIGKCYLYYKGYADSAVCDEYVPDTWTTKTNAIKPGRSAAAASSISSKGYVYCGYGYGETRTTEEYVPDTWVSKTDAPYPPRTSLAASTINDKGYIYCGAYGTRLQDCDEYTPDTWLSRTSSSSPGRWYLAASTINSKGYIYGGYRGLDYRYTSDVEEYTPDDTWTIKTNFPSPTRRKMPASTINSKGYIYCGESSSSLLRDCDEYTPDTWAEKTSAPSPARYEMPAAAI